MERKSKKEYVKPKNLQSVVRKLLNEPTIDFSFRCKLALSTETYEIPKTASYSKSLRKSILAIQLACPRKTAKDSS